MARGALHLNLACPINQAHPLARGLVAHWRVLPGFYGGNRWMDLQRRAPATLQGLRPSSATVGWGSASYKGGWGTMRFDGSAAGHLTTGRQLVTANTLSFAAWIYVKNFQGSNTGGIVYQGTGALQLGTHWCASDLTHKGMIFRYEGGTYLENTSTLSVNTWYFVGVSCNAGTGTFYKNGLADGSASGLGSGAPAANNVFLGVWYDSTVAGRHFNGYLDAISIWNRPLSAPDWLALYGAMSRQPSSLYNWLALPANDGVLPAGGGVSIPALVLAQPQFLGVGVF